MANSNQFDGTVNEAAGKVQDALGGLTGDLGLQAEGKLRQQAGQTQAKYGDSVDQIAEATRNDPLGALLIAAGVGFLLGKLL
ncbi:CsbD family protein [Paraburkholderia sediminicola]|uniref:CsbD family protein n=1 Tax=Paraburkholderia rhynchosiae TaxID=487049 RepID=A0ACC7NIL6_9BURK